MENNVQNVAIEAALEETVKATKGKGLIYIGAAVAVTLATAGVCYVAGKVVKKKNQVVMVETEETETAEDVDNDDFREEE